MVAKLFFFKMKLKAIYWSTNFKNRLSWRIQVFPCHYMGSEKQLRKAEAEVYCTEEVRADEVEMEIRKNLSTRRTQPIIADCEDRGQEQRHAEAPRNWPGYPASASRDTGFSVPQLHGNGFCQQRESVQKRSPQGLHKERSPAHNFTGPYRRGAGEPAEPTGLLTYRTMK